MHGAWCMMHDAWCLVLDARKSLNTSISARARVCVCVCVFVRVQVCVCACVHSVAHVYALVGVYLRTCDTAVDSVVLQ